MSYAESAFPRRDIRYIFKQKLEKEWKHTAVCGRQFVLTHKLKEWMNTKDHPDHPTNAGRLLTAVYSDYSKNHIQPVDSEDITHYLLVFAILLQNDLGSLVHHFTAARIDDSRLPWPLTFQGLRELGDSELESVEEIFDQDRWAYCPVKIQSDMKKTSIDARSIMPFCRKQEINGKGGTAQVFQVLIQEHFISPDLQDMITDSRIEDDELGVCYQLALKTYKTEEFFKWETEAFMAVRGQSGMVQCIGSYSLSDYTSAVGNKISPYDHHVLLEFGELDLDEFFCDSDPPVHPLEIIGFWDKFFKVADALQRLHYLEFQNRDGSQRQLHGWHADIKPDNILCVHGEFKLADFGFAKFQVPKESSLALAYIEGGTQTYGAPEFARQIQGTRTAVSQAIDMWSFGCVLSVAVTWVVLGFQGVCQYERLRRTAISQLRKRRASDKSVSVPTADDAFHDGKVVLQEVLDWFDYLHHAFRRSDFVCEEILDLVRGSMLQPEPTNRITSHRLCEKLTRILLTARQMYDREMSSGKVGIIKPTIIEVLQDDGGDSTSISLKVAKAEPSRAVNRSLSQKVPAARAGIHEVVEATAQSDQDNKTSKRKGKLQRLEKKQLLKTAYRAVQHSQVFPQIPKRLNEAAPLPNSTIPEEAPFTESPTGSPNTGKDASMGRNIVPPLPPKFEPGPEASISNQIVASPPLQPSISGTFLNERDAPAKANVAAEVSRRSATSPVVPSSPAVREAKTPPADQPAPQQGPTLILEWPLSDPYGDAGCSRLRDKHPNLDVFRVGKTLNTGQQGGKLKSFFTRAKKDKYLQNFIQNRDIVSPVTALRLLH